MVVTELDTHMIETATFCGIAFTEGGIAMSHHQLVADLASSVYARRRSLIVPKLQVSCK